MEWEIAAESLLHIRGGRKRDDLVWISFFLYPSVKFNKGWVFVSSVASGITQKNLIAVLNPTFLGGKAIFTNTPVNSRR